MKPCPACRREVQDFKTECPYCGVALAKWKLRAEHSVPLSKPRTQLPPHENTLFKTILPRKLNRYKIIGLGLLIPALIIQSIIFVISLISEELGFIYFPPLSFYSMIIMIVGLAMYAKSKGRAGWWGFLAFFSVIGAGLGLVLLRLLPDLSERIISDSLLTDSPDEIQNPKEKLKDFLYWGAGLSIGLLAGYVLSHSGLKPLGNLLSWIGGLLVLGIFLGMSRPQRPWRWCIALGVGICLFLLARPITQNPWDPIEYVGLFMLPAMAILASIPAIPGAFLGAFLRQRTMAGTVKIWRSPEKKTSPLNVSSPISILVILFIIGILAANGVPGYISYTKRSRTAQGLDNVVAIHQALVEWQGDPTTKRKDGRTFSEIFIAEGDWLANGDKQYSYSFGQTMGEDGKMVPLVTATARNSQAIFGEILVSLPSGESTVSKVSDSH